MTPTGMKPSGVIKPANPKSESVVNEIKSAAGMTPAKPADQVAAEAGFKPTEPAAAKPKTAVAKKTAVKAAASPNSTVVSNDLAPLDAVPAPAESKPIAKPVRKLRTPKVVDQQPVPVLPTEPADSPATPTPKARKPRKTTASKAESE